MTTLDAQVATRHGAAVVQYPTNDVPVPFLVAAVGRAAGGLLELSDLLEPIPPGAPLAIILVADEVEDDSRLPAILAQHTALKVVAAAPMTAVERGHVYVVRAGTCMTIIDGYLAQRAQDQNEPNCVDTMFASVADFYGSRSVAVAFAGCSVDTSASFRKVQAVGGTVLSQAADESNTASTAEEIGIELVRLALAAEFAEPN